MAAEAKDEPSVHPDCEESFRQLKLRKKSRYIVFRLDGFAIVVDSVGERGKTFEDLAKALPSAQCRYAVFDKEFKTADGRDSDSLHFINWLPPVCKANEKMTYTSERGRLRSLFDGVFDANAGSLDELKAALGLQAAGAKGKAAKDDDSDDDDEEWDPDA